MALPVIADVVRCGVEGVMPNGRHWANVLHFKRSGVGTWATVIAALDPLLYAFWNTALSGGSPVKQYMNNAWSMQRIRYTPLDGTTATVVIPHVLAGSQAGDALPSNVALVMSQYTALRGRQHRGRTYIGGFDELFNQTTGVANPTYVATLNTQAAGLLTSLVGSVVALVVASYKYASSEPVTALTFNGTWDTQRRRNRP